MKELQLLEQRRSVPSRLLGAPGPDATTLEHLVRAAIRVPDHGKLDPFRLISIAGEARARFGAEIAAIHARSDVDVKSAALEKDRARFAQAPMIITVVARITAPHKVPEQEQLLSAGCVAYNLLLGAQAVGFGAQWLTGWAAYDREVAQLLGLADNERVIGFVHIGTPIDVAEERTRPALGDTFAVWQ